MMSMDNVSNANSRQTTTTTLMSARGFCCRLLVVLHQQHHQPDLLRALQHQLPAHLLAHPDVPLEPQATAAGATLHLLRRLIHHHEVMRGTPTRMREHWHVTRYFIARANSRSRHDDFGRYGRAKTDRQCDFRCYRMYDTDTHKYAAWACVRLRTGAGLFCDVYLPGYHVHPGRCRTAPPLP